MTVLFSDILGLGVENLHLDGHPEPLKSNKFPAGLNSMLLVPEDGRKVVQETLQLIEFVVKGVLEVGLPHHHNFPEGYGQFVGRCLPHKYPQKHLAHQNEDVELGYGHTIAVASLRQHSYLQFLVVLVDHFCHKGDGVVPHPTRINLLQHPHVRIIVRLVNHPQPPQDVPAYYFLRVRFYQVLHLYLEISRVDEIRHCYHHQLLTDLLLVHHGDGGRPTCH